MPGPSQKPTWICDIAPMFVKRARAERWSGPATDLASYRGVIERKHKLLAAISSGLKNAIAAAILPKDFTEKECALFQTWLSDPETPFMDIDDPTQLRAALQAAIEVELATLPPYLTAMYSIKDTKSQAYTLIGTIVMQEMAHFGLACNLLVSIGGTPDVTSMAAVPYYPTQLPAGLRPGLTVHLRKYSVADQVPTFMSIEQPVVIRTPKYNSDGGYYFVDSTCEKVVSSNTIGDMYNYILAALTKCVESGQVTIGNVDSQVSSGIGVHPISSLDDARKSINTIIEQGEGALPDDETGLDPYDDTSGELAHYYKFSEMLYGKSIVRQGDGFAWSGAAVDDGTDGVYNMMDDPDISKLPGGSDAYTAANNFIDGYVHLLANLSDCWKVNPENIGNAIQLMRELACQAVAAMQTDDGLSDGFTVGTPFQL